MRITGIDIQHYALPLEPPFHAAWDPEPRRQFIATVVEVHTDQGITGIGSGDLMVGFAGHEHLFIGQDPTHIQRHWQVLDNLDFHYGRPWPLDLALWDLMGKAAGLPVHALLGARRRKILAYASTGELVTPEERAQRALAMREQGFRALKIRFHHPDPRQDIQVVETVRRAVGDTMDILVDANQGWRMPADTNEPWDLKRALAVARELEDLGVFWLEEPLAHHDYRGMAELRRRVGIRVAGGEMNRRWPEFRELLAHEALDVYQPDAALCGGITGCRRVGELAQAQGAWLSPHTWTGGVGLWANLHLALAFAGCPYLEFPYDPPAWTPERRDFVIIPGDRLMIDAQGYLDPGDAPGLGFTLDTQALARYRVGRAIFGKGGD